MAADAVKSKKGDPMMVRLDRGANETEEVIGLLV